MPGPQHQPPRRRGGGAAAGAGLRAGSRGLAGAGVGHGGGAGVDAGAGSTVPPGARAGRRRRRHGLRGGIPGRAEADGHGFSGRSGPARIFWGGGHDHHAVGLLRPRQRRPQAPDGRGAGRAGQNIDGRAHAPLGPPLAHPRARALGAARAGAPRCAGPRGAAIRAGVWAFGPHAGAYLRKGRDVPPRVRGQRPGD